MSPFTYVLVCHCWMSSYLAIPIQGDVQNTLSSRFFSDLAHFFKRTTVNVILSGDLSDSDEELTFSAFMGSSSLFWLKFIPFSISHNHNFLALDGRNPPALCVFLPDVMQTQDSEWFKLSPSHIYLMPSNIPDWVLPKLNHQVFNYNVKNDGSVFLSETYYLKGEYKLT